MEVLQKQAAQRVHELLDATPAAILVNAQMAQLSGYRLTNSISLCIYCKRCGDHRWSWTKPLPCAVRPHVSRLTAPAIPAPRRVKSRVMTALPPARCPLPGLAPMWSSEPAQKPRYSGATPLL